MKQLILPLLLTTAFAACTPNTPTETAPAEIESAKIIGIDFAAMPVGTKAYYENSDGDSRIEIYTGKKDGFHIIERYWNGESNPTHTLRYTENGLLRSRVEHTKNNTRTFIPYRCDRNLGKCTYENVDTNPKRAGTGIHTMSTTKSGDTYYHKYYEADTNNKTQLGQFNLRSYFEGASGFTDTLVKIEVP